MLTADLIQARVYRGAVKPRYIDETDPDHLALAEQLIDIFSAHTGCPRYQLDEELADLLGTGTEFLLHRALAKLLADRCEFEVSAAEEPDRLRQAVFRQAAAAYRQDGDAAGVFSLAREEVVAAAAGELEVTPGQVEEGLYGDLKEEQILERFEAVEPAWLLARYNVALAQGVLLRATSMTIELDETNPRKQRALFRKIKFFRLMHRISRRPSSGRRKGGWSVELDGPLSLFQASQKYGLQMAIFLPTLLHFDRWRVSASVLWGRDRQQRGFELSPDDGLAPYGRLTGQWQPEELSWLPEQLAKLDRGWKASAGGELIDLGGEGVLVPDFVFEHDDGTRVTMEVLGFWRRGAVESRLELLRRHGPERFILALSKQLAAGREEELAELPGQVYLFRAHPIARQVVKLLDGFRPDG